MEYFQIQWKIHKRNTQGKIKIWYRYSCATPGMGESISRYWYCQIVWSPLLLQYWHRLHKFWRQKTWCDLPAHLCQYFLSTSYQQPLPHGQSLLNPTLWRTFKLGKPSLPSLMSMTMTIMTWESQFTAAFKRIESSRSGPAHHYWSNTALSDHHNDMVVMKIKLWTPNTSTTTRFSTFCNIVRGMTGPIPPIRPALKT